MLLMGPEVRVPTDNQNRSAVLDWEPVASSSRLVGGADLPPHVMQHLHTSPITFFNQKWGIPSSAYSDPRLSSVMTLLATVQDRNGRRLVAAAEGRDGLPIYGAQFHSEKIEFETNPVWALNHSAENIRIARYFARFFVGEARRSQPRRQRRSFPLAPITTSGGEASRATHWIAGEHGLEILFDAPSSAQRPPGPRFMLDTSLSHHSLGAFR